MRALILLFLPPSVHAVPGRWSVGATQKLNILTATYCLEIYTTVQLCRFIIHRKRRGMTENTHQLPHYCGDEKHWNGREWWQAAEREREIWLQKASPIRRRGRHKFATTTFSSNHLNHSLRTPMRSFKNETVARLQPYAKRLPILLRKCETFL